MRTIFLTLTLIATLLAPGPIRCRAINVNARSGDTVTTIARRYATTPAAIRRANPGHDLDPLLTGQTITVRACTRQVR